MYKTLLGTFYPSCNACIWVAGLGMLEKEKAKATGWRSKGRIAKDAFGAGVVPMSTSPARGLRTSRSEGGQSEALRGLVLQESERQLERRPCGDGCHAELHRPRY